MNLYRDGVLGGIGIGAAWALIGIGVAYGDWVGLWIFVPLAVAWSPRALHYAERRRKRRALRRFIKQWERESHV